MLAMLQSAPSLTASSEGSDDSDEYGVPNQPLNQAAANVLTTNDSVQLEMLCILKELSTDLKKNQNNDRDDRQRYHCN